MLQLIITFLKDYNKKNTYIYIYIYTVLYVYIQAERIGDKDITG